MKKKIKKWTAFFLSFIICIMSLFPVYAADNLQIDNKAHDYSEINTLANNYSYGTVSLNSDSKFILTDNNTASLYKETGNVTENGILSIGAKKGEIIEVRVTKSAIDKDGDICDVIIKTTIPELYVAQSKYDALVKNHVTDGTVATSSNDFTRVLMNFSKYDNSNLLHLWLYTNGASTHFTMKYVKTGTDVEANIKGAIATIYDIDIYKTSTTDLLNACEFVSIDNSVGNIYYQKNTLLSDTNNNGACVYINKDPSSLGLFTQDNAPYDYSSATIVESFDDSTYRMYYGGEYCGIGYTFASPYMFSVDSPLITVDKDRVFENEKFNYKITQYIPNNFFAKKFSFISNINEWNNVNITGKLDPCLNVTGNIAISNEKQEDVTSMFDIEVTENLVTATIKQSSLSEPDFYAHYYNMSIPVCFKENAGKTTGGFENSAKLTVDDTVLESNTVYTALKYTVNTNALIDNGTVQVNDKSINTTSKDSIVVNYNENLTNKITFQLNNNYKIKSAIVDNNPVSLSDIKFENGYYYYDIQDDNITENISHSVIISTELKEASVTVNYKDTEGKELTQPETITGKVLDKYTTQSKTFYGYDLTAIPDNATGIMTEKPITVEYIYRLKDSSVIVYYLDDEGKELAQSETITGKVFDEYNTEQKDFYGYELTATPENAFGSMTEDSITIKYIYTKKPTSVVVNYLNEKNEVIADSETITGKVGNLYNTSEKDIYGYELTTTPDNASGAMSEETITVNYVYRLKNASVIVNYLDENGNKLADSNTITGFVFDKYNTVPKDLYEYDLIETPDNYTGTMMENNIVVNYIYALKPAAVTVQYITEKGEPLSDNIIITGKIFDEYNTQQKDFYGYELTVIPDNAFGSMTVDPITVNYIYRLKNATVTINYLDEEEKALADSEIITGKVFDEYSTQQKDFYGYELTAIPDNATGAMAIDPITVNYVYRLKDATVVINYLDENGNQLTNSETITGHVFDEYKTTEKDIEGYKLKTVPDNAFGTMSEETITVTYIYSVLPSAETPNIIDTNNHILHSPYTGDYGTIAPALFALIISGISITATLILKKKERNISYEKSSTKR